VIFMKGINRRKFLQLAGTGSLAAATVAVPVLATAPRLTSTSKEGTFTFRAVTGLPSKPLPSYASYVVEGHVNLSTRTGVMTKTVFAGSPQAMSTVALPGLSRIMRITDVQELGGTFRITGVVDDRSQLQKGESAKFDLLIDPAQRLARTNILGSSLLLRLEE
jgi:hypothetical protein